MQHRVVVRIPVDGGKDWKPPNFTVAWTRRDSDMEAYDGIGQFWEGSGKLPEREWKIAVTVSIPAIAVNVIVEGCQGGCWTMYDIPGHTITGETLWWAAIVALEALKRHPEWGTKDPRG